MTQNDIISEAMPSLENADAKELACEIAKVLDSKKARDIKIIHV